MRALKFILKEFGSLLLLILAVGLSLIVFPLGLFWSLIIKPIYHLVKRDPMYSARKVGLYFANFAYQIWNVFKSLFFYIAYVIDLLGNVFSGELIEDIITPSEENLFGRGNATISAAIGELEERVVTEKNEKLLNGRGKLLSRMLDFFEAEHCKKAYESWKRRQNN